MMTLSKAPVTTAHLVIPARGPWTAEVTLDSNESPPSAITLAEDGGVSLAGVVARGGLNPALLRWEGILVGGAGGLGKSVIGAYNNPQVGDVLDAICEQAGETVSSDVSATLRAAALDAWTLGRCSARAALDVLSGAAAVALGEPVTWRTMPDGSIWMGVETWPSQAFAALDDIVDPSPLLARTIIASQVAALLPGVDLEGVGRVTCAEHWVSAQGVRTWAWTRSAG